MMHMNDMEQHVEIDHTGWNGMELIFFQAGDMVLCYIHL